MKKKIIIIAVIIIFIAAGVFVVYGKITGGKQEKKIDRIEIVRYGSFIVKLSERGNLEPLIKVEVRSNVEGEIEKLYVKEGYDVVKGQKLLKIDDKQIREEYNQAQANYDAALADMKRAEENINLSGDRLESDIQLAENTLKSAQANLEATKSQAEQQRSQARISITNTENLLAQDNINLKKAKIALEQAESSSKSAKARLDNSKSELDRKRELHDKKFVALREVETAKMEYDSTESQYESALKNIQSQKETIQSQEKIIESRMVSLKTENDNLKILEESLNKQIKQVEIQVQQAQERLNLLKRSEGGEKQMTELTKVGAEANLFRAKSMLNKAKERLDWTTIIAPMTGKVVQCKIEEGEIVISGRSAWSQTPAIMVIADLSKMIIKAYIHEFDIDKVKVGHKVEIKISAYPDELFEGEVTEISPSGQMIDGIIKFMVTIAVTKAPKPLMPGMTTDVDIIVGERDNVLQLPIEAVIMRETIKVNTDVKQDMLSKLKDQKIELTLSNHPDKKFSGKVIEIKPPRLGFSTSEAIIIMDGTPKELQPGTNRSATIILPDGSNIPNIEARIESEKGYFVKLVKDDAVENSNEKNKQDKNVRNEEERMIKVGDRTQNNIEILEGLKEGDKVRVVPIGEERGK